MSKVRIFADSISDVPQDWIDQYNIEIVPLYIVFQEKSYVDRLEINAKDMYNLVEIYDQLPKTAAPPPADFIQAFRPVIESGEDILFISMSSHLSSTYQNALAAAREFPAGRITVVDSLNVTAGTAMSVLLAAQMASDGKSALAIAERLEKVRHEIQLNILVDNLDYLHKGGRVSSIQNMIGSILRIRPVLYVSHGKVLSGVKYRGSKERIVKKLLQDILSHIHRIDHDQIIIAQTLEEETAEWIRNMILEETSVRNVHIIEGGCSICSHSGPHSLAISFILKSEPLIQALK
ncbi:fatty acid-binding protein DegV [Paenibacillus xylanexedens]|uniref:DegV family protein n=1 Tax=Paenibacillus xylanexedens TaxID=528191 RepID=UPI000938587E|nr:DegV family protein [Paenibacillus xylanexedens]APO46118.1 fatty acid-binding protein DegV [Paenibacillus xylanexedens]